MFVCILYRGKSIVLLQVSHASISAVASAVQWHALYQGSFAISCVQMPAVCLRNLALIENYSDAKLHAHVIFMHPEPRCGAFFKKKYVGYLYQVSARARAHGRGKLIVCEHLVHQVFATIPSHSWGDVK